MIRSQLNENMTKYIDFIRNKQLSYLHNILPNNSHTNKTGYFDIDNKHWLFWGPCQVGKTYACLLTAIAHIIFYNIHVIMIVRNKDCERTQLKNRANNLINKLKQQFNNLKISIKTISKNIKKDLDSKQPSIFIVMANHVQIGKLTQINKKKFMLIVDEADQVIHGEGTAKFRQLIQPLIPLAGRVIETTATAFASITHNHKLTTKNVIVIPKSSNYIGAENISYGHLDPNQDYMSWLAKELTLDCMGHKQHIYEKVNKKQPNIILVKLGSKIKVLFDTANNTLNIHKNTINIIYYQKMIISSKYIKTNPNILNQKAKLLDQEGDNLFWEFNSKILEIGHLITYAAMLCETTPANAIVIYAGLMADRSISFNGLDINPVNNLKKLNYRPHVCTMFYNPKSEVRGNKVTVANITHHLGRLSGNFGITTFQRFWGATGIIEDTIKGVRLQSERLNRLAYFHKNNIEVSLRDFFNTEKISKEKIVTKRKYSNYEFNISNIVIGDDGYDTIKSFKPISMNKIVKPKNTTGKGKGNKMIKMKNAYLKGGLLTKIIDNFKGKAMSKGELEKMCYPHKFTSSNFTTWNLTHNKYKILQKRSDGYHVYPEIITFLKSH